MLGLADSFVQWVCGFLREGFLADFSPVLSSLRPHGLEAGDFIQTGPVLKS